MAGVWGAAGAMRAHSPEVETVSQYEFTRSRSSKLGSGSYAVVYMGRHISSKCPIAVKVIEKRRLSEHKQQLNEELNVLKELNHRNVVALLAFKETSSEIFLVTEGLTVIPKHFTIKEKRGSLHGVGLLKKSPYCNAGDLGQYLNAHRVLSESTIAMFTRQIASALRALNAKGIVHRDLKPQNILLTTAHTDRRRRPTPQEITLKIADFGFAKILSEGAMAGTLCGTPFYMAPEVLTGQKYDAKADLFSLAVIIYQCLIGQVPFRATNQIVLSQFYMHTRNLEPPFPHGISSDLRSLLVGLFQRDSSDRMNFEASIAMSSEFTNIPLSATSTDLQHGLPTTPPEDNHCEGSTPPSSLTRRGSHREHESPSKPILTTPKKRRGRSAQLPSAPPTKEATPPSSHTALPSTSPRKSPPLDIRSPPANLVRPSSPDILSDFVVVDDDDNVDHSIGDDFTSSLNASPIMFGARHKKAPSRRGSSPIANYFYPIKEQPETSPPPPVSTMPSSRPANLNVRCYSSPIAVPTTTSAATTVAAVAAAFDVDSSTSSSSSKYRTKFSVDVLTQQENMTMTPTTPTTPMISSTLGFRSRRLSGNSGIASIESMSPPPVQFYLDTPPASPKPWSRRNSSDVTGPRLGVHRAVTFPNLSSTDPTHSRIHVHHHHLSTLYASSQGSSSSLNDQSEFFVRAPSPVSVLNMEGPISFVVPELAERTLMNKEHNDLQGKLEFVLCLVETIVQLAVERSSPLSESISMESSIPTGSETRPGGSETRPMSIMLRSTSHSPGFAGGGISGSMTAVQFVSEDQRCLEQIHLYVRALMLLSSSLQVAHDALATRLLHNSPSTRRILREMNEAYQHCLAECQRIKSFVTADALLNTVSTTADKLLYGLALEKCQYAATEEMLGNLERCVANYRAAYLILHSLSQQAPDGPDREQLCKYTEKVGKRFLRLTNQGSMSTTRKNY